MAKIFLSLLFGLSVLFSSNFRACKSQQSCSPPDYPIGGSYAPRQTKFQPGDTITYSCEKNFTLMGKDSNKCKSSGEWSNRTPFCDRKAVLTNPYAFVTNGVRFPNPEVIDTNRSTCFSLKMGEKQLVTLERQRVVYAVRLYLGSGATNIEIYTGRFKCTDSYVKYFETSQWVMIICKNNDEYTNTVTIQDKSPNKNNSTICEIEIYTKEEDGCENPPERKISNGYFAVSRSKARLICEEGYKSDNTRLVCEGNEWKSSRLQCEEILCNPRLNFTLSSGSEWSFIDAVKKISAGTRRQLKCSSGYRKIGGPDIVVCQKNGTWTETNASCIEDKKAEMSTRTIIFAVVGVLVVLIIIALLATTIYFVRKQRDKQVVVVYKTPTEGSVISGSDGSGYYETIQNYAPVAPPSSRPPGQMIPDGYFLPFDSKDTVRKKPMPADIAFDTLKQSTLYGC